MSFGNEIRDVSHFSHQSDGIGFFDVGAFIKDPIGQTAAHLQYGVEQIAAGAINSATTGINQILNPGVVSQPGGGVVSQPGGTVLPTIHPPSFYPTEMGSDSGMSKILLYAGIGLGVLALIMILLPSKPREIIMMQPGGKS